MSFTISKECDSDLQTDAVADKPRDVIKDQPSEQINDQRPDNVQQVEEKPRPSPGISLNDQKPKVLPSPTKPCKKHGPNTTKTRDTKNTFPPQGAGGITVNISQSSGIHVGNTIHINMSGKKDTERTRKSPSAVFTETDDIRSMKRSTEPVTIADIQLISSHIGENWKELGRVLGYSEGQLDQFKVDNAIAGLKEVIFQLLLDWKRTNTKDATVSRITSALLEAEQFEAVEIIAKVLACKTTKL